MGSMSGVLEAHCDGWGTDEKRDERSMKYIVALYDLQDKIYIFLFDMLHCHDIRPGDARMFDHRQPQGPKDQINIEKLREPILDIGLTCEISFHRGL